MVDVPDIVINNITPLSLGIELSDGSMSILIKRNTPIPAHWTEEYETNDDNQTAFFISVYEGEYFKAQNNYLLGEFTLEDIPPKKKGEAKMKMTFDVNSDNLLTVTALNLQNNKYNRIEIKNNLRANDAAIRKMIENVGQQEYDEGKRIKIKAAQEKLVAYHSKIKAALETVMDTPRTTPMELHKQDAIETCGNELKRVFKWMDENDGGFAEPDEYEYRIERLKEACTPILGEIEPDDATNAMNVKSI